MPDPDDPDPSNPIAPTTIQGTPAEAPWCYGSDDPSSSCTVQYISGPAALAMLSYGGGGAPSNGFSATTSMAPNHGYCNAVSNHQVAGGCAYLCTMQTAEPGVTSGGLAIILASSIRSACPTAISSCPTFISIDKFAPSLRSPLGNFSPITIESCVDD